jgi:hypothetical protein
MAIRGSQLNKHTFKYLKSMKNIPLALFIVASLLTGCKDNETKISDSKYYLVNKRNIGTTISTYQFQSKSLTPDFYTFSSENGAFVIDIEAKDNYAYATTYGQKLSLKKIDLQSGADVKVVNLYNRHSLNFTTTR